MEPTDRLAVRPTEAARMCGLHRSVMYKLLAEGEIVSRRHGRKTLILMSDLKKWLESLEVA